MLLHRYACNAVGWRLVPLTCFLQRLAACTDAPLGPSRRCWGRVSQRWRRVPGWQSPPPRHERLPRPRDGPLPHLVLGRSERQPRSPGARWPRAPHARARRLCRRCMRRRPAHRARASLRTRGRGRAAGQMNWLHSRYPVKGWLLRLVHARLPPPCAHCRHKSRGRREIWAMVLVWAAQRKRTGNDPG